MDEDTVIVLFTATPFNITIDIHSGEKISSASSIKRKVFATKLHSSFGVSYHKFRDVGMKRQALKDKDDCLFWSSTKRRKEFSKINDSVKSELQEWIITYIHVIQTPIENYYITVKFDVVNIVVNTELFQRVLLQVSVRELHIDMLKTFY